jgi:4-phytase/acid phosphatase
MKLRVVVVLLVSVMLAGLSSAPGQVLAQVPVPPGWQLERAVLISRHGVRSPTQSNAELDEHSASPWPAWPVAPGYLTPHGFELMQIMGTWYRVLYGGRGLVQSDDCPPTGTVGVWTDIDQRTRESGVALMRGMYPRCMQVILHYQDDTSVPDPLFNPQPTPSCPMDPAAIRQDILDRIGGNFSSVTREFAPQLNDMHAVLCPPGVANGGRCQSPSALSTLEVQRGGWAEIKGPIGYGATAAETFLMEAADGLPPDQVAWGRVKNDAELAKLLTLQQLNVDLTRRALSIARQKGSNMLAQVMATLLDGHNFPGLGRRPDPVRFALLVGHETNIYEVQRLLKLGWQIPGFPQYAATPGGALAFELYREIQSGQRYVRVAYYAQTLQQMRNAVPLNLGELPGMEAVEIPACAPYARDKACPLERFIEIAKEEIEPACVTIKP